MVKILRNRFGKFLVALLLGIIFTGSFYFFNHLSIRAQEQIKIFPTVFSGDWQNPEAVLIQDLDEGANFEEFNVINSTYPLETLETSDQQQETSEPTSFWAGKIKNFFKLSFARAEEETPTPMPAPTLGSEPTPEITPDLGPTPEPTTEPTSEPSPEPSPALSPTPEPTPEITPEPTPLEPVEKALELSNFSVSEEFSEKEIKNVQLRFSLAGKGSVDDKLIIEYYYQDAWQSLAEFNLENEFSNALNGGYFLYALPIFENWEDLNNFKIRFTYSGLSEEVYLDAAWLEVEYEEEENEEELTPEEIEKLPRIQIEKGKVFKLFKKDFQANEEPEIGINIAALEGEYLNTTEPEISSTPEPTITPAPSPEETPPMIETSPIPIPSEESPSNLEPTPEPTPIEENENSNPTSFLNQFFKLIGIKEVFAKTPKIKILKTEVFNPEGAKIEALPEVREIGDEVGIRIPKPTGSFRPGKYTISVEILVEKTVFIAQEEFTWGVLAINTNKSIYLSSEALAKEGLPPETAYLQMAALRDNGHTICDANLILTITDPSGTVSNPEIQKSGECGPNNVTNVPDYFAYYQVGGVGNYQIKLTNLDNGYEITDSFEVRESVPFEVERIGPTRIYPPASYQMALRVKVNQDFTGEIKEYVPSSFVINDQFPISNFQSISNDQNSKQIVWQVDWKAGEIYELKYQFDAPDVSPYLYLLGPVSFQGKIPTEGLIEKIKEFFNPNQLSFQEARQWQIASDAPPPYKMTTGRYVGSGNYKQVSGLGFAPEAVIIKASTTGGVGAFLKTTSMIDNASTYLGSATADDTTGLITLDPDGFTVTGANANIANTTWTWAAFAGSDCSSSGNFCVGRYTGSGTSPRLIATGFQPDIAIVKITAATTAANFQTVGMTANYGQYFMATAQETTGALFTSFSATGFNVGATNNTSAAIYNFIAFKNVSGSINVGSYTGNGTSQSITGAGFAPDFVFVKNAPTAVGAVYNLKEAYGNSSSYFADTANVVGAITSLDSDGFSVGSSSTANGSTNLHYWMAFHGTTAVSSSGTFTMATGTYTGNGAYQNFNGLGFAPDLVIIKGNTTAAGVFRMTQHNGDVTSYLDAATADFALGIQSLNPDGFNIGTSTTVNSNGVAYYWIAYGNAWRPATNSGASDFVIGTYYGNGIDSRNITGLPFQPDLVAIKAATAVAGTFRTSQHSGDLSSFFAGTAEAANNIQAFNTDGFQVGTAANVNTAATFYRYFAFKTGSNFAVGTYSGTGVARNMDTVGFQPDNLWVKHTGTTIGVERTSDGVTDSALPFTALASVTGAITTLRPLGFSTGTSAYTNTSGTNNYRYAAWKKNTTVTTPPYKMTTGRYVGSGNYKQVSGLGFAPEAVIIKASTTGGVGAFLKTTSMIDNVSAYLGSATADDANGLITLDPDGFTVTGTNANIANTTWTWAAFGGSDCSATGNFCVGRYTGNGTSPRLIATGFQPDIVLVKNAAVTTAANFQTVGMTANYGQYLMATAQETTGALFTSFSSTGFNVGATNNTSAAIYNYIAFKNVSGSINVGSFTGNGTSQSVTTAGFAPDFVVVKNTTGTAVSAVYNLKEAYGDSSSYFTDTANVVGAITALTSNGFNVGASAAANGSTNLIFWMAFYGTTAVNSSGTFTMATGTYTGNGAYQNFNGLGFAPDLVIIKGNTTAAGVFRTTQHNGDVTSYLDAATADFALGIQSLNPDGFNIGTHATVNSNGVAYYWIAYGNAWRPATNSGASDFVIGTYYGNGIDSRNITGLPFQPDLDAIKGAGAQAGTFRTSQHSGDLSSFFAGTAEAANNIQAFNTDGFQVGTAANVNTAATFYRYFAFKTGSNFAVGTYSGTGVARNMDTVGFQPDNLWVKHTGTTIGVERTSDGAIDSALPFTALASVTGAITTLRPLGFSTGTSAYTNTSGTNNYRYAAWKKPAAGNQAPSFTVGPAENPASTAASPTNSGSNVTFQATATDTADSWKLLICKENSVNPSSTDPTCGGTGEWCKDSSFRASGVQSSCSYVTTDGDAESKAWYAFACDNNASSACSSSSQGSGDPGTPFYVNRRPSFTVFSDNSPVNPAATVTWTTTTSDSDSGDTLSLFVCKANDFTGTVCGGGGTWCSTTGAASNPTCNTAAAPRPDGNYNAYGFVIDNHSFAASGGAHGTDSILAVNNVSPSITNTTIQLLDTDQSGNLALTVAQGETIDFLVKFVVTDNNSCQNITSGNEISSALIHVRMSELTQAQCDSDGEDNNNNCYANAQAGTGGQCVQDTSVNACTGITDTDVGWRCEFPLQYHADPTTGTPTPPKNAYSWTVAVQATDDDSANTGLVDDNDGNELGLFMAYGFSESSIAYGGPLYPNDESTDKTSTIIAKGNVGLDCEYSGTQMSSGGNNIPVGQQKYDFNSGIGWSSMTYTLSGTAAERELNCQKTTTTGSPAQRATYWKIKIPSGQMTGSYSGIDTLSGVTSEDNW